MSKLFAKLHGRSAGSRIQHHLQEIVHNAVHQMLHVRGASRTYVRTWNCQYSSAVEQVVCFRMFTPHCCGRRKVRAHIYAHVCMDLRGYGDHEAKIVRIWRSIVDDCGAGFAKSIISSCPPHVLQCVAQIPSLLQLTDE